MANPTKGAQKKALEEKEEKRIRLLQLEDVRQAINHGPTFRWIVRELYDANVFEDPFHPNNSVHAHASGKKAAMQGLMDEIAQIPTDGPQLVAKLTGALYEYRNKFDSDRQQQ